MSLITQILPVNRSSIADENTLDGANNFQLDAWSFKLAEPKSDSSAKALLLAADALRLGAVPVAFPTETVYGLGANAFNGSAVKKIFAAKRRPADNPLIVHVGSLKQLRQILLPRGTSVDGYGLNSHDGDPIPSIYKPIIAKFWPGPLSIILPNPVGSLLATEVTAGLDTFAVRMPNNLLALALCRLSDVPIAAPSANASGRPSPTTAQHVFEDLASHLEIILDGGPCEVGVESTVIDGLSDPPCILRPGGIGLDRIRQCSGWENTINSYDHSVESKSAPKAPGMKYRHYSPKAKVVLVEAGQPPPTLESLKAASGEYQSIGIIRTLSWLPLLQSTRAMEPPQSKSIRSNGAGSTKTSQSFFPSDPVLSKGHLLHFSINGGDAQLWDLHIGKNPEEIARGLFSALRALDAKGVGLIYVEGIDDGKLGDLSAAVMNRLRKAAGENSDIRPEERFKEN
ncbi:MAG: hypothetical protein M1814_001095 [Vezdaea aestivalis]|nr:MAG: hypothetical protein M1814_001095 [Vezdaea aestivalis]